LILLLNNQKIAAVGASLLAMVVNDEAGDLNKHSKFGRKPYRQMTRQALQ
jgi:hypothetical protein